MHTEVYGEPRQINTEKVRAFDSVASWLGHPVSTEDLAEMGIECAMQLTTRPDGYLSNEQSENELKLRRHRLNRYFGAFVVLFTIGSLFGYLAWYSSDLGLRMQLNFICLCFYGLVGFLGLRLKKSGLRFSIKDLPIDDPEQRESEKETNNS